MTWRSFRRDLLLLPVATAETAAMYPVAGPTETALYAVTVAALFVRRRFPVPVLVTALPVTFGGHLLIAPMVATYEVSRSVERRRTVYGWSLAFFLTSLGPWWPSLPDAWRGPDDALLFGVLSSALMTIGPTAMGQLSRARRQLADHIQELSHAHRREAELIAERAVVAERARLAREMHDVVSYQVSLMTVQAGALERTAEEPAARETASVIRGLGATALRELRGLLGVLRTTPGDAALRPRLGALPDLVAGSGLDARLEADLPALDALKWPAAVEEAAYRTVQEALTNVRKHAAGAAVTVTVGLVREGGRTALAVEITNTAAPGGGTEPSPLPSGGHGLTGLRERAEQLGGEFTAGPVREGFRVRAVLPASG
ncbi:MULTISPECIES: sensor histidine kinase [Streptomyces]|uniref:sensor histidine kinase n=1 Tax=Streptomyces TaxID=1883 RepID=UPI00163C073C|nr:MULTISPECIES: histidine kinase [Streptomyces]MBC2874568.1 two-component sensor histidine kinase [Streptomyces sp. TYQ1024]UBI36664.1 histidine kinase [Streptomyces mobaraensis]UKW29256.1 histidine kinase [Streptomyces sp. TYQ1024]